jgi:hypothetical protein
MFYSASGILTTGIFWALEIGCLMIWGMGFAIWVGTLIVLGVGYVVKYRLDERFVFGRVVVA